MIEVVLHLEVEWDINSDTHAKWSIQWPQAKACKLYIFKIFFYIISNLINLFSYTRKKYWSRRSLYFN